MRHLVIVACVTACLTAQSCVGNRLVQAQGTGVLAKRLDLTVLVGTEIKLNVGTNKKATKFKIESGPQSMSITNGGTLTWTPLADEVGPQSVTVVFRVKGKTRRVTMKTVVVPTGSMPKSVPATPSTVGMPEQAVPEAAAPGSFSVPVTGKSERPTAVPASDNTNNSIRNWTSSDGKFSVKAKLLSVQSNQLTLLRADNLMELKVPLDRLSKDDRDFVVRWVRSRQRDSADRDPAPLAKKRVPMSPTIRPTVRRSPTPVNAEIRVIDIDASAVQLQPFGRINKFTRNAQWYVERALPARFAIRGLSEGFTMDAVEPARDQADKRRIVKESYDALMDEIPAAGFTFTKRTVLDPNQILRTGVQYIAVAKHPAHGERHVMTRIRFDNDYTFIFQVSGEVESRVKALVELSDTFVRDGVHSTASPLTTDMASKRIGDATKTIGEPIKPVPRPVTSTTVPKTKSVAAKTGAKSLPTAGEIAINREGNYEYRLEPFGVIGLPKPDFKWRVESRSPPVFICESPERSSWLRLSVRQAIANDDQTHDVMLKNTFAGVMKNHLLSADKIGDTTEHAHTGDGALMFRINGLKDDSRFEHEGKLRFDDDYTFFFETFSKGDSPNADVISQTSNFFLTDAQAAKLPKPNVPKDVVASLSKEIEKLKEVMAIKTPADVEAMVRYTMPPGQLEEFKSSGQFDAIVDRVLNQTGPELLYSLNSINWERVEYDADMDSVSFHNAPFGTIFVRENGKWKMQF